MALGQINLKQAGVSTFSFNSTRPPMEEMPGPAKRNINHSSTRLTTSSMLNTEAEAHYRHPCLATSSGTVSPGQARRAVRAERANFFPPRAQPSNKCMRAVVQCRSCGPHANTTPQRKNQSTIAATRNSASAQGDDQRGSPYKSAHRRPTALLTLTSCQPRGKLKRTTLAFGRSRAARISGCTTLYYAWFALHAIGNAQSPPRQNRVIHGGSQFPVTLPALQSPDVPRYYYLISASPVTKGVMLVVAKRVARYGMDVGRQRDHFLPNAPSRAT